MRLGQAAGTRRVIEDGAGNRRAYDPRTPTRVRVVDVKPWHIVVLLIVVAIAAYAAWLRRAFHQGRRR